MASPATWREGGNVEASVVSWLMKDRCEQVYLVVRVLQTKARQGRAAWSQEHASPSAAPHPDVATTLQVLPEHADPPLKMVTEGNMPLRLAGDVTFNKFFYGDKVSLSAGTTPSSPQQLLAHRQAGGPPLRVIVEQQQLPLPPSTGQSAVGGRASSDENDSDGQARQLWATTQLMAELKALLPVTDTLSCEQLYTKKRLPPQRDTNSRNGAEDGRKRSAADANNAVAENPKQRPRNPPRKPRYMRSECFEDAMAGAELVGPTAVDPVSNRTSAGDVPIACDPKKQVAATKVHTPEQTLILGAVPTADPFAHLQLAPLAPLEEADRLPRMPCPRCGHSGKHYCKMCLTPLLHPPATFPRVRLPIPLIVYKHGGESNTKSSAVHAQLMAPEDVTIVTYPVDAVQSTWLRIASATSPTSTDGVAVLPTSAAERDATLARFRRETAVLFPDPEAVTMGQLPASERSMLRRIIVVDGTWTGVRNMMTGLFDCVGGPLRTITLAHAGRTHFWRPNDTSDPSHLSTIEAVYALYREYAEAIQLDASAPDVQQLDNLLYMFAHQHRVVGQAMRERTLRHANQSLASTAS